MASGGYVIQVGSQKPAKAIISAVGKDGRPTGQHQLETFISVGKHHIMNQCRVWGKRVLSKDAEDSDETIEATDPKYKGVIKFMDWGKIGGYAIEIRWLPQSHSLDFEYQENVQKLKIDKDKGIEGVFPMLELDSGENKFDHQKDALKIEFLKVHSQNRDSKSKNSNPAIKGHQFFEVTDEMVDRGSIKRMEDSTNASYIVMNESSKPLNLRALFEIMGKRPEFGDTDRLSNDGEIYKVLLNFAQTNSHDFLLIIEEYKKEVSNLFELAKSHNALDTTKNGDIGLVVNEKKELVFDGLKGKGEQMIDHVLANYSDAEIYKKTQGFKLLVQKLK
mgnify:CR=1 FL=1